MTKQILPTALLILAAVGIANAHFVWVERNNEGPAQIYFGEWAEDVHEKTGGLLDKINPQVFTQSDKKTLSATRRTDHLEVSVKGTDDVRFIDRGLAPREDKKEGGKSKTIFYGKAGRLDTTAKLDFELVPLDTNGNVFTLMFRGSPLSKTDVTVYGPPKWEKPLQTDDQGRITVPMPWTGMYVLRVAHTENAGGEFKGEKFDRTRHVATLSFVQKDAQP